jgi:ribosomal protein L37E
VTLLPDDTTHIDCPRCGKPALFTSREGSWE